MLAGVFTPWQIQVVVMVTLLMGYIACYRLNWLNFQIVQAYVFGGLSTGLGLQFLVAFGSKNDVVEMIIVPLLLWLVLRILFMGLETKYTLSPDTAVARMRAEDAAADYFQEDVDYRHNYAGKTGTSAWAGDNSGKASIADASGYCMRYDYFARGEICMGGPTDGDAIFSNKCAFSNVGPSIALSEDGHYAAMCLPSRDEWGLLIVDLQEKRTYAPKNIGFWEFDRIEEGVIYGRHSPITHNTMLTLSIEKAIASATELPMAQDDGWWVIDYEGRKPFTQYPAITIASNRMAHKLTFVPNLTPFKSDPFLSDSSPSYILLIDNELLGMETRNPTAIWVDGKASDSVCEGRFLVLSRQIIDFKDNANNVFSVKNKTVLPFLKGCDENTYIDFDGAEKSDTGDGGLLALGYVYPRSTNWDSAEYGANGSTSPYDDEERIYWDVMGEKQVQKRTRSERNIEYKINLDKFSHTKDLKSSVHINLVNRGKHKHQASLLFQNETNVEGGYSSYQLNTSCGVVLEDVTHEAIWSHCGRYLAVVHFELPPLVPHRITIIDFETASIKEITRGYALPSFIWFDKNMLDLTHVVGVEEYLNFGITQNNDENQQFRLSDPAYTANPYELLIGGIEQRRASAERRLALKKDKVGYSNATVSQITQHCILFAPDFDVAILQPPINVDPE